MRSRGAANRVKNAKARNSTLSRGNYLMGRIDKGGVRSKSRPAIDGGIIVLEYPNLVDPHVRSIVPAMLRIECHVEDLSRAIRV